MQQHATSQPRPLFTASISSLIQLERDSEIPLYRQICQRLREAILSGELTEGARLPTERALASELGVNRTTVMNAYNQLASEGLVEGHVGRGTLVRRNNFSYDGENFDNVASWLFGLPAGERELLGPDAHLLSELAAMGERRDIISLAAGTPARDLLPAEMLSTIFAEGLLNARQSALGYCPVEGILSLRRGVAARMRKRGVAIDAQHILILSGSTQGIGLAGRLVLSPGDEVVLEDDPYGEMYFEGKEPQPLMAMDRNGQVLYLSTYSKTLAPGLRVAWMAAPEAMIERLSLHKQIFDLNTNAIGQWAVSEVLQRGLLDDHLTKLRRRYQHKRDLMLQAISTHWPRDVRVSHPQGGFHIWCRLLGDMRARSLLREAAHEQVAFVIGEPFHVDGGGQQQFRLSFAYPEEEHIEEGVRRVGNAMRRLMARRFPHEEPRRLGVEHVPMV